jgi:HSP20 family protein
MLTRSFFTATPVGALAEMDRLFDSMASARAPFWAGRNDPRTRIAFPALNVYEDNVNVYAEAELPGLKLEDLDVSIIGNELTIKGKRQINVGEGVTPLRRERLVGEFERTIELPIDIEVEQVEASLANGVLLITLPKARAAQPRKIQVRGSAPSA